MIIITGATGFVGRRLVNRLVQTYRTERLLCLILNRAESELEITGRAVLDSLGIRQMEVNLISGEGLNKVPKSPEMIFHLAADTDTSIRDHDAINQIATRNLFESLMPLPRGCVIQFTSSIAVGDHRVDMNVPCREATRLLQPYHRYGRAKLATETYLQEIAVKTVARLNIIRLCAIYGHGTRTPGLFRNIRNLIKQDSWVARFNYPGKMSFTHVEDIAEVLVLTAQHPPEHGNFRIFTPVGEVLSLDELLEKYSCAMGKTRKKICVWKLLWKAYISAAKCIFYSERFLHYRLYNKIWQLSLTVGNGFWNESDKWNKYFPDFKFRCFDDCLDEMIK